MDCNKTSPRFLSCDSKSHVKTKATKKQNKEKHLVYGGASIDLDVNVNGNVNANGNPNANMNVNVKANTNANANVVH